MSHKVAAHADNFLFFIINPEVSLPSLVREFDFYSQLSNNKINLGKSEAMNLTISRISILKSSFPFKGVTEKRKYLRIYLMQSFNNIFQHNFPQLLSNLDAGDTLHTLGLVKTIS